MPNEDRFRSSVVQTIAKRAGFMCSNPDCRASTSGPTDEPTGSSNVGEAAHIYGANSGSARYETDMTSGERSSISNAIWLCSNCHKMIDDDPTHYPPGLLFEWLTEHEAFAKSILGKAGAEARRRYEDRHLEEFGRLSFLAERILREKEGGWEYRLSAEVLRYEMEPIQERWRALKNGLYVKPSRRIPDDEVFQWISRMAGEMGALANALGQLMNNEFAEAWGEFGVPGDDKRIVATCRYFAEVCRSCLEWEEEVRFASVDHIFEEIIDLMRGVAGIMIDEVKKVPEFLDEGVREAIVEAERREAAGDEDLPPIEKKLSIVLTLPKGWNDKLDAACQKAASEYSMRF